jgi:hypothetical protein
MASESYECKASPRYAVTKAAQRASVNEAERHVNSIANYATLAMDDDEETEGDDVQ